MSEWIEWALDDDAMRRPGQSDLIEVPPPKRSGTVFVNVYESVTHTIEYGIPRKTKDEADDAAGHEDEGRPRLACVKVEWTEGGRE